jgi:hypothetical protein
MTAAQFQAAALDLLRNYWRIKAANAIYRSEPRMIQKRLEYANVPAIGFAANQFGSEAVADALRALDSFLIERLPRDLLLALVAELESRLVSCLRSLGEPDEGTFGQLQGRVQSKIAVSLTLIEDLSEIRERRNMMIHHGDIATARYVAASSAVLTRAGGYVKAAVIGDNVAPTEQYLAYASDIMVMYSNAIS